MIVAFKENGPGNDRSVILILILGEKKEKARQIQLFINRELHAKNKAISFNTVSLEVVLVKLSS